jgi:hypothetical protein
VERVTGIGGVFIRSARPDELRAWYAQHLGFDVNEDDAGSLIAAEPHNVGLPAFEV